MKCKSFLAAPLVAAMLTASAAAVIQDSFNFTDVLSEAGAGDAFNDIRFGSTVVSEAYTLQGINFTTTVAPDENPTSPGSYPTWGQELVVRVTHDASGEVADVLLGRGEEWYDADDGMDPPNPIQPPAVTFSGTSYSFAGQDVSPGDSFTFEFWDRFDDFAGADATHSSVTLEFDDAVVPTIGARGSAPLGTVRFDAWGTDQAFGTWPTAEVVDGEPDPLIRDEASYWGVEFGPTPKAGNGGGEGPPTSIASITLDTQNFSRGWWDPTAQTTSGAFTGFFEVGDSGGIDDLPTPTFDLEDPDFPGTFQTMTLDFTPGDFTEGDFLHFGQFLGILNLGGDDEPLSSQNGQMHGEDLVAYDPGLIVTIEFSDGSTASGPLAVAAGENYRSFIDLVPGGVSPLEADFDKDGDVDGDDFLVWQTGFNQFAGDATPNDGDADGNGLVNGDDFLIWQTQFGSGIGDGGSVTGAEGKGDADLVFRKAALLGMLRGGSGLGGQPIPEPGTIALCGLLGVAFFARGRRR